MDEFQPEDELKPDASDRPAARNRKSSSPVPKLPVSKQHIMIAVGILVLLLLILGIGAALKGPSSSSPSAPDSSAAGTEKSIDLSGSSASGGQTAPAAENTPPVADANTGSADGKEISMPEVASTPSQAAPVTSSPDQQTATIPSESTPPATDAPAQSAVTSSLPTAPATLGGVKNNGTASLNSPVKTPVQAPATEHRSERVNHDAERKAAAIRHERELRREREARVTAEQRRTAEQRKATAQHRAAENRASETRKTTSETRPAAREVKPAVTQKASPATKLPAGAYTLQLSGATRKEALNAWARQQNLTGYHVYQTQRNGQPWYVLVSGSYATSAEAKSAINALPQAVRAKSPWVKPLSQVRKEAAQ